MISRSDIENLKRLNGIRKKLGLGLDAENLNMNSLLIAIDDKTKAKAQK